MSNQLDIKQITLSDGPYRVFKLPEPNELVSPPSPEHNYAQNPYGPGTIGFEKTMEEINLLKNNYFLVSENSISDLQSMYRDRDALMAQARELQEKISTKELKALRVTPNGVYEGYVVEGEVLNTGGILSDSQDAQIAKDGVTALFDK
jgi:hypothetical protein